jgi:putative endonuclease
MLLVMPAKAGIQEGGRMMPARERQPCVYILASKRNGTLYVGVTSDAVRRVWQHKTDAIEGFTSKYAVKRLVYLEMHATMPDAILREQQLKAWKRGWKLALIERDNPEWRDLYDDIAGAALPIPQREHP